MSAGRKITAWLASAPPLVFNLYCMLVSFATYFSMYAFRKPFTVGAYSGSFALPFLPALDYKIVLIIAQIIGYTLSKFMGIKIISGADWRYRAWYLVLSITIAELALLGFALATPEWRVFFIFLNGIPLGLVWGFVFSYLEGRRSTELLAAALSASYIISSGAVKSVGNEVLHLGIDPYWMPALTGLLFLPGFLLAVKLLSLIPPPSAEEERLKSKRRPMSSAECREFFWRYFPGLSCLIFFFMFLTAYRDFRDNFAREIWADLGYGNNSGVFTSTEVPIALIVMVVLSGLMVVRRNERALLIAHCLLILGAGIIGGSTYLFQQEIISPKNWMMLIGLGCYLAYVPFGTVLFDRIIAVTGTVGTAGFMMYLADSFGYLGSVCLLLFKNFVPLDISLLEFFIRFSYVTAFACATGIIVPLVYFSATAKKQAAVRESLHSSSMASASIHTKNYPIK